MLLAQGTSDDAMCAMRPACPLRGSVVELVGRALELRRDPDNEHDPNAIAVHAGGEQVGWVPRELAEKLAPQLDDGRPWSAIVLREQRRSPRDPRHGLTMLLAPDDAIELRPAIG